MFNADQVGVSSPISLEDYVRLPHVLTSLRKDEHGVVDEALAKVGLTRTIALTTSRFMIVPSLVAGAPVIATMPARIARFFAASLGLSLSPAPVKLPEPSASLVWHASYDRDPATCGCVVPSCDLRQKWGGHTTRYDANFRSGGSRTHRNATRGATFCAWNGRSGLSRGFYVPRILSPARQKRGSLQSRTQRRTVSTPTPNC
jgi:LysR substrate binding domain